MSRGFTYATAIPAKPRNNLSGIALVRPAHRVFGYTAQQKAEWVLDDLAATIPEGREAKAAAILALDDDAAYCDSRDDICQLYASMLCDVAGAAYRLLGDGCAAQRGT